MTDMSDDMTGIPHPPGTATREVAVTHPTTSEEHTIHVPLSHDGSRIKVEFPDGATTYTEGFDPAERALSGERPVVPCDNCGAAQVLTATEFDCSACGAHNKIELRTETDRGEAQSAEG